jgi:TPR repeat protein
MGDDRANYFLARVIMQKGGVEEAVSYFETAAEAGHTTAMLWLARILTVSDSSQAIIWLEKARDHMDLISWHQVAAVVYSDSNPAKSAEFENRAKSIAQELRVHIEPLEPLRWRDLKT